jgi:hypothetical protein
MITPMALDDKAALSQMQTFAEAVKVPHVHHAPIAEDSNAVPGFPQDAFMEMGMDRAVDRPQNYGLPQNWSAGLMGMMSLVRVLPADLYDRIMALPGMQPPQPMPPSEQEHHHG